MLQPLKEPVTQFASLTLHQLDRICDKLDNDLRWLLDETAFLHEAQLQQQFCLDFDIIYPGLNLRTDQESEYSDVEFWSSLVIDLPGTDVVLLPGTLYEMLSYAQNRLQSFQRLSRTAFGSAFIDAINKVRFEEISAGSDYNDLIKRFQATKISKHDFYLLSILQHRAQFLKPPLPETNPDLFYECLLFLSSGMRANRISNNRVDAYNYCLVTSLNTSERRESNYILVSTSRYMHQLDAKIPYTDVATEIRRRTIEERQQIRLPNFVPPVRRTVVSPRRAAVFRLLNAAGDGRRHAHELSAAIRDIRAELARRMANADASDIRASDIVWVRSDNLFLQLIASIVNVQTQVKRARDQHQKSIELYSTTYSLDEPANFFEAFKTSVQKVVQDIAQRDSFRRGIEATAPVLRIEERQLDTRFNFSQHRDLLASDGGRAASYFDYGKEGHLFVGEAEIDAGEFMNLHNTLISQILAKIAARRYEFMPDYMSLSVVVGDGKKLAEQDLKGDVLPLSLKSLTELFRMVYDDINFVRVKNSWFDVSFEGKFVAIATRFPIIDEIGLFLQQTAPPRYRQSDFSRPISRLLGSPS